MRFKIVGANAESGDDVAVVLEAPSKTDVERIAHDQGILVSSIAPEIGPPIHKDMEAISLVEDEDDKAGKEHSHGLITVSANNPSESAKTSDGHAPLEKHAEAEMEFHIMQNQSLYLLETAVNRHIAQGWEPQGGVAIASANNALNYFQALIRRKKKSS
jgi:hypothetical protein